MKKLTSIPSILFIMSIFIFLSACPESSSDSGSDPIALAPPAPGSPAMPADIGGWLTDCLYTSDTRADARVHVIWTDMSDDETGFEVEYWYMNRFDDRISKFLDPEIEETNIEVSLHTVSPRYVTFRVRSFNDAGASAWESAYVVNIADIYDHCGW